MVFRSDLHGGLELGEVPVAWVETALRWGVGCVTGTTHDGASGDVLAVGVLTFFFLCSKGDADAGEGEVGICYSSVWMCGME